jgi:hypothetical protein
MKVFDFCKKLIPVVAVVGWRAAHSSQSLVLAVWQMFGWLLDLAW